MIINRYSLPFINLLSKAEGKAGSLAIKLAGSQLTPRIVKSMVLDRLENRWRDVKEKCQMNAGQHSTPPGIGLQPTQLMRTAYSITLNQSRVTSPDQPLCGLRLTFAVNDKLRKLMYACPAGTREGLERLLSPEAVHARALTDMNQAIRKGRLSSPEMLLGTVMTFAKKAPRSSDVDAPFDVRFKSIVERLALSQETREKLIAMLPDSEGRQA